ncbi:MAG: MFS transporter [Clostridiaceae bacterium]|nr:MFS transporter [Clostridiaceae bacterium]
MNIIKKVFFNETKLQEKDLHTSRVLSIFEGSTARTVGSLTAGAFIAGYIKYLGADDRLNGIIAAIPVLSGVIMFLTPLFFETKIKRKAYIVMSALVARLLLSFLFLVPLIIQNKSIGLVYLAATYLLAHFIISFINPTATTWQISLAPENIRGKYFGLRESCVLGFVSIMSLGMGRILDIFRIKEQQRAGFLMLFIVVLLLSILNFIFACSVKEPEVSIPKKPIKKSDVLVLPLKDKVFRKIIYLFLIWNIGYQMSAPFISVYMISELNLNYTFITITAIFAAFASVITVRLLGKLADKRSWFLLLNICVGFQTISQLLWFFVNQETKFFFVPLSQLMGGAALGGINISLMNIQYKYSPENMKTIYIGFSSAIGGIVGFVSSVLGSLFISVFSGYTLKLGGFSAGSMQVLFGLSGIIMIYCMIYIHFLNRKLIT